MKNASNTREKLVTAARTAFWLRGYSNVPLRDIAGAAKVDVALIARYFGGKAGLFEATLDGAFDWPELFDETGESPIDVAVKKFAAKTGAVEEDSVIQMILMNASDPEVGALVQKVMCDEVFDPLCARMGGDENAVNIALFISIFLGLNVARADLKLPGLIDLSAEESAHMLRHMITAAMTYRANSADSAPVQKLP